MIITFLGTKGGTGTTTMAVNCAAAIHRLSKRSTLLLEVKPGPGDLALYLALRPRHSLIDLIEHAAWDEPARLRRFVAEHDSGLHVLGVGDAFGRPESRDREAIERIIDRIAEGYRFAVIDGGSVLTAATLAALAASDVVVLVANPDLPCLRNVPRFSDALRAGGVAPERVRFLLNRAADDGTMPLAQLEQVLGRAVDFHVASDYRTVSTALNAGVPIGALRATPIHEQLDAMARTLINRQRSAA